MTSRLTSRFVTVVATAAVAPLLIYGAISLSMLRAAGQRAAIDRNLDVAEQAADRVALHLQSRVRLLQTIATALDRPHPEPRHASVALRRYARDLPELRELTLWEGLGSDRRTIASSRMGHGRRDAPRGARPTRRSWHISDVTVGEDAVPVATVTVPVGDATDARVWLAGELTLETLWQMVDDIRVGHEGFAGIINADGRLIAHGNPDAKTRIARPDDGRDIARRTRAEPVYLDRAGRRMLGVAATVGGGLGWTVVVEQPASEAYAVATELGIGLSVVVLLALVATVALGTYWSRSFLRPIVALMRGTQAIAAGRFDERVEIPGRDEFHRLGTAFNRMADKVAELEDDIRKQERHAMFGRIAGGLVHDLAQPIQSIGNSCRLMLKLHDDNDYRDTFRRTVDREMAALTRTLEDLRNVVRPQPLERFPVNVNRSITELVESMAPVALEAGLTLEQRLSAADPYVDGDAFALARVYRNLIVNAIEATSPGGLVTVSTDVVGTSVEIAVTDTGHGIPQDRLDSVFEDFKTTKPRGLGLGLALSRKIVEQLGGTIDVASVLDRGTTFVVRFPLNERRSYPAAVAAS